MLGKWYNSKWKRTLVMMDQAVIEFVSPPDALILCGAFNELEANLFATGNSLSEIQLWNFKSRSPVEVHK